jgi:hypothetical protein
MKIETIQEHDDGSATITFNVDSKEVTMLLEVALTVLIAKDAVYNYQKKVMEEAVEELDSTD